MAEFSMPVARRRADAEGEQWTRQMTEGSAKEREESLTRLHERASRTNDPNHWNELAIALHYATHHEQAQKIFDALVDLEPNEPIFRLNLATSLSQRSKIDLVRYHLGELAENAPTEEFRRFARELLDGYEAFVGATETDERLRRLQITGLEERLRHDDAAPEDFVSLARIYLSMMAVSADESFLTKAIDTLEKGRTHFPGFASILEHLMLCYARSDPHGRMAAVSLALERIAPESTVLQALDESSDEEADTFVTGRARQVWQLFQTVAEGAPGERAAALNELRRIVAEAPENPHYRSTYAMALMFTGDEAAAAVEADRLLKQRPGSHSFHFNFAQVLWALKRHDDARMHMQLADDLGNDEERGDVAAIRAEWEKHG